jgi:REP element-mobilizing transposase RayT
MPRLARGEYLNPEDVQIVHSVQRCVRRAFLCGDDATSGKSFEHRRLWIRERLEFLASVFGVDCLTYTVLSNHLHLVLRSRPDVVAAWTDDEVARRWLKLFPQRRTEDGSPESPSAEEIKMVTSDELRLAEVRRRLSDISWWMRCTAENIARRANREDECTGRFWEGRYKAQLLLDEASLLACAAYVDLNPIRAAIANTPEESEYTGAKDRIDDLTQRAAGATTKSEGKSARAARSTHAWERSRRRSKSGWMSPLEINETSDPVGPDVSSCGRRASLKGFLSMPLSKYLELLDWTGRQLHSGKRGTIPSDLSPILQRLGLDANGWCDLVQKFGKLFKRAAGSAERLSAEADRRGQAYMHAPGAALLSAAGG